MDIQSQIKPKGNKKAIIITSIVIGVIAIGTTIGYLIYKKKEKASADSSGTSSDTSNSSTDTTSSSSPDKTSGGSSSSNTPTPAAAPVSASYANNGSPFKFTNMPAVYAKTAGQSIKDMTGKEVGKTTNNQLLGVAESVQGGFVIYVDKNAKRYKIIWNAVNVLNGK